MNELASRPGSYVLWLEVERTRTLRVGRLGQLHCTPGFYAYVGSAFGPGGIRARLGRHFRVGKVKRWHIDYLRAAARVHGAWVSYDENRYEHEWAQALIDISGDKLPLVGFGASDCACKTHLTRFDRAVGLVEFQHKLTGPLAQIQVYGPNL